MHFKTKTLLCINSLYLKILCRRRKLKAQRNHQRVSPLQTIIGTSLWWKPKLAPIRMWRRNKYLLILSKDRFYARLMRLMNSSLNCYRRKASHFLIIEVQEVKQRGKIWVCFTQRHYKCFTSDASFAYLLELFSYKDQLRICTSYMDQKKTLGCFLQFTSHKLKTLYAIKPDQSVSQAI